MQPATIPPDSSNIAIRYGLNFGLIQAVIAVSILLFDTFVARDSGLAPLFLGNVGFLLILGLYFGAGILASKRTGRLGTSTLAGLWTGVFCEVISFIASLVIFSFAAGPDTFQVGAIFVRAMFGVLGAWPVIGLGIGLATLGGLIVRGKSQFRPAPVVPVYPTYPTYPVQPQPYAPVHIPPQSAPYPPPQPAPPSNPDQPYMEQPH